MLIENNMGNPYNKEKLASILCSIDDYLSYNQDTGVFTWKIKRSAKAQKGSIAGAKNKHGYIIISINSKNFYAHQIAWMMVHKRLPDGEIDHINFDRSDNRLVNLRELPQSESVVHRRILTKNTSGYTGVGWKKANNKWQAKIGYMGKSVYLGLFDTAEQAYEARKAAEIAYYPILFQQSAALEKA